MTPTSNGARDRRLARALRRLCMAHPEGVNVALVRGKVCVSFGQFLSVHDTLDEAMADARAQVVKGAAERAEVA